MITDSDEEDKTFEVHAATYESEGARDQWEFHSSSAPEGKPTARNAWGNATYAELITQAILSSPEKRLTLTEIYEWIVKNVSYFSDKAEIPSKVGWKVSLKFIINLCIK